MTLLNINVREMSDKDRGQALAATRSDIKATNILLENGVLENTMLIKPMDLTVEQLLNELLVLVEQLAP